MLFGICEREVVREIVAAHEAAVVEALGYLGREACMARRGHGGEAAREALVDDWCTARERGSDALMIAHRRSDVADLSARARQRMRDSGGLTGEDHTIGRREYAVGDRVLATRNEYALGLVNGDAGVVVGIADDRLAVALRRGRRVDVPLAYIKAGGLDHGYAITAHRAQGATVDEAFVLGSDELYREWGYTALSRHRTAARFYVTASPTFLNQAPRALKEPDDVSRRVAAMLSERRDQRLALDGGEPSNAAAAALRAALERRRAHERDRASARTASASSSRSAAPPTDGPARRSRQSSVTSLRTSSAEIASRAIGVPRRCLSSSERLHRAAPATGSRTRTGCVQFCALSALSFGSRSNLLPLVPCRLIVRGDLRRMEFSARRRLVRGEYVVSGSWFGFGLASAAASTRSDRAPAESTNRRRQRLGGYRFS